MFSCLPYIPSALIATSAIWGENELTQKSITWAFQLSLDGTLVHADVEAAKKSSFWRVSPVPFVGSTSMF